MAPSIRGTAVGIGVARQIERQNTHYHLIRHDATVMTSAKSLVTAATTSTHCEY